MQKIHPPKKPYSFWLLNLSVVLLFVGLMLSYIIYFNESKPNLKLVRFETFAESFKTSVQKAHVQWQAEGQPDIVILSTFTPRLDDNESLVETDKHPIFMSIAGWPKAEFSGLGCERIWDMVLNTPLSIKGFKVIAEYYDGVNLSGNSVDSRCRFRLSGGAYFEYKVHTGEVLDVENE